MKTCKTYISAIFLATSLFTIAQDLKLGGFQFSYLPGASISESLPGNPEIELTEFNFFLNLPKKLKADWGLMVNGVEYRQVRPSNSNSSITQIETNSLHQISYRLMWLKPLKNNWSQSIMLVPSLASSFRGGIEGDDFLMSAIVSFTKKKSEELSYGFGALISSQFGSPLPLPMVHLKKETETSKFEIFLPSFINYQRTFNNLTLGLRLAVGGAQFNTSVEVPNNANFIGVLDKIRYSRVTAGPTISYRLNKLLVVHSSGGMVVARRYEFTNSDDNTIDYSLENGPFFRFGFVLAPTKRKSI